VKFKRLVRCFFLLVALASQNALYPQISDSLHFEIKGKAFRSLTYFSHLANENLKYSIYLPPGYSSSDKRFPVFYLLHGLGGNETSWISDFSVHRVTDSLIVAGAIPPLIIVMPEGRRSYYINDVQNRFPYEDILMKEFIPYIDSLYCTIASREYRVLGGLSMGGYGAVVNCIKHPDVFSTAIALSAAIRTDSMIIYEKDDKYNQCFKSVYGDSLSGNWRLTSHWIRNNPLYMVIKHPDTLKSISWYFDCGLSDYLMPGNEALHDLFTRYKIPHQFHVRSGGHERAYWESGLVPALKFAGEVFRNKSSNQN
jgi:enterochelin esterase-like enzyme